MASLNLSAFGGASNVDLHYDSFEHPTASSFEATALVAPVRLSSR